MLDSCVTAYDFMLHPCLDDEAGNFKMNLLSESFSKLCEFQCTPHLGIRIYQ